MFINKKTGTCFNKILKLPFFESKIHSAWVYWNIEKFGNLINWETEKQSVNQA